MSGAGFHSPLHNQLHLPRHIYYGDETKVIWEKKTDFFFLRFAVNIFTFFCVYDMRIVLLKGNGQTLMKWLSEQFWRCCPHWDVTCDSVCVCAKGNRASHKLYYQRMWADKWRRFYSCTTACHSTAALLQTGTSTSILTLHRHFLSARYLSGLCFSVHP